MHLPSAQSEQLTSLAERLQRLTQRLFNDLDADGPPLALPHTIDLTRTYPDRLFLLRDGQLRCEQDNKVIYLHETGDLVGLAHALGLPGGSLTSDEPVTLVPYRLDSLLTQLSERGQLRAWSELLLTAAAFFRQGLAELTREVLQPATGFLHFQPGETIIRQGDRADHVYTLLEGKADVFKHEAKVGEVLPEETFGAMAVFTREPRSASVVAASPCTVVAVPKDQFLTLVEHQPRLLVGLIEEMASKINVLNERVLGMETHD